MNTKTTKFLAVLAVFAMAFAAFAAVIPAQGNEATGEVYPTTAIENYKLLEAGEEITVDDFKKDTTTYYSALILSGTGYTISAQLDLSSVTGFTGIFLLPDAEIKIDDGATENSAVPKVTSDLIFGAAVKETTNDTVTYKHANASEIKFAKNENIYTDYKIKNKAGVIDITSNSKYLTQSNIVITDKSAQDAWGGVFDPKNVVINENGTLDEVHKLSTLTSFNAGVVGATTIVKNKIVVNIDDDLTLTARGIINMKGGMEVKQTTPAAKTLTFASDNGAKFTGDITAFSGTDFASKISADACNAGFTFTVTAPSNAITGVTNTATSLKAGQLTLVSGDFRVNETTSSAFSVEKGATLNIASGATLTLTSDADATKCFILTIEGSMYLSGKLTSSTTGYAATLLVGSDTNKDAVFKTRVGATMTGINFSQNSKGSVDITTVLNEVGLSGQIESSNEYTASQIVTLLGDLTITNHATITIHGYLVIPAGYTLKIEDGSVLIVDGIFSESEVYGDIEVSKDSALYVKLDKSFDIHGELITNASGSAFASLLITSNLAAKTGSTLDLAGYTLFNTNGVFTIETGATVQVSGPIMTATGVDILNAGDLVFDGATVTKLKASATKGFVEKDTNGAASLGVKMTGDGAVVDVDNLKFAYGATSSSSSFVVTDKDIVGSITKGFPVAEYYNTITVTSAANDNTISGLMISEKVSATTDTSKNYHTKNDMQISGEVAVTGTTPATIGVAQTATDLTTPVTTYGSFTVVDELELLEGVILTFNNAQKVTVSGDVTVENKADIDATGTTQIVVKGSIDSYVELGTVGDGALSMNTYEKCIGAQFKADTHSYVITTVHAAMTFAAVQEGKVTVAIYGKNTITENMYITANVKMINGYGAEITVKKDVAVEVIEGASVAVNFVVEGTLYANVEKNITGTVTADVKVTDGVAAKWTSLANALATAEAGDIILITNSTLKITDSLTIPEEVTVVIPDGTTTTITAKKTLTVNGILICDATSISPGADAKIVVNGLARFIGSNPATIYGNYSIAGAYYTEDNYVYVSNLSIASESEVEKIYIYGDVTVNKSVNISGQEIILTTDSILKVSDLTLTELAAIDATNGKLSGTVIVTGLDGGNAGVMAFTDFKGEVAIVLYSLIPTAVIDDVTGTVTIVSGAVTIDVDSDSKMTGTLNVLPGAEFFIPYGETVSLANVTNTGEIYVLGTLNIDSDKFINAGLINVAYDDEDQHPGVLAVKKISMAIGSIIVDDGAKFNLNENLVLGSPATSVNGGASIEGVVTLADGKYILAYADADVSEMIINPSADGASTAKATEFYINGMLYMTLIAGNTNSITYESVLDTLTFDIAELNKEQLAKLKDSTAWGAKDTDYIGAYATLSADIDYKLIAIQASWVKGLSLYVDGVRISTPGALDLSVGVHLVSVTVDAGYACDNIGITFNGVAVTPAGIFVEVDDTGSVLAVTGDVYIPEPEPVTPEEKSEWTITTILLVVLVILIAIMAVIVALRLNRS